MLIAMMTSHALIKISKSELKMQILVLTVLLGWLCVSVVSTGGAASDMSTVVQTGT
jgi:hypothetical protein